MTDEKVEDTVLDDIFYIGRMRELEEMFINYVVEGGKTKRTKIESHIMAYLLLHPKLTQAQIHQLSHEFYKKGTKTGISRGKISSFLKTMTKKFPIVKKNKVLIDKNYTYVYSFEGSIVELMKEGADLGLNIIHQMIEFFKQKLANLMNLSPQERSKSKVYPILLLRIKEIIDFWEYYIKLFASKFVPDAKEKPLGQKFYQEIEDSTPDLTVNDIEEELVKALSGTTGFMVDNEDTTKILSYLTLRKRLTQSKLRKLTGFSAGFISQSLNLLIENDLVEKIKIPGIRKPFYEVDSIPLSYLKRFRDRLGLFVKYKPELEEALKEFQDNKEGLEKLNGHERIKYLIDGYVKLMPMIEQFYEILLEEIEKFEQK